MQTQQEDKDKESKLRSKLNRITNNKKKISKSLKSKEREIKQLKSDLVAARHLTRGEGGSKVNNDKLSKLQKEVDDKNRKIDRLTNDNQNKDDIIESLRNQINDLQSGSPQPQESYAPQEEYVDHASDHKESEEYKESEKVEDDEDEYKDEDYEDPQESQVTEEKQERAEEEVKDDEDEPKGELKSIISESDVDPLFEKLKLVLQRNQIKYNNMSQLFPDVITIADLDNQLKTLGLKDSEERFILSRYIVEPRTAKIINYYDSREISKSNAENILKSKIEAYSLYQDSEEEMKSRLAQQVGRYVSTLKDSLELEDLDGSGFIQANSLKS